MDEDKLLEELRVQRNLLKKHLEWLDQKIEECEAHEVKETAEPRPVVPAETELESARAYGSEVSAMTPCQTEEEKPAEPPDEGIDHELSKYTTASGDPILRAKIGCLALFVLSIALFLFLLFGLPYLLD